MSDTTEQVGLPPCPFCGESDDSPFVEDGTWCDTVVCRSCHCVVPRADWMRRPIEDALRAEVERINQEWYELSNGILAATSRFGVRFLDPPDGGDVSQPEQVERIASALVSAEAEVERLRKVSEAAREAYDEWMKSVGFFGWQINTNPSLVRLNATFERLRSALSASEDDVEDAVVLATDKPQEAHRE